MKKEFPQRKSPRLNGYDYSSAGMYFVTICTHKRDLIFGNIINSEMQFDSLGELVHQTWLSIPDHKPQVSLDYFVVMPNHFYGIVVLHDNAPKLGTIIGHFKGAVTRQARENLNFIDTTWQSRYHDRIIRNEAMLKNTRQYVLYNVAKWETDEFYKETYL